MRFFAEIQFRSAYGDLYWLPLEFANCDKSVADDYFQRVVTAVAAQYSIEGTSPVRLIIEGLNSERIAEYRKMRARGTPKILRVAEWQMHGIDPSNDISFAQASDAAIEELIRQGGIRSAGLGTGIERRTIVHTIENTSRMPDEYLCINVVMPVPDAGSET